MSEAVWFYLIFWTTGGILLISAVLNTRLSHIRYISSSEAGRIISRILAGGFGLILIGIGILLRLASG